MYKNYTSLKGYLCRLFFHKNVKGQPSPNQTGVVGEVHSMRMQVQMELRPPEHIH